MARGPFHLTRVQARGLAKAIRQADWLSGIPGDYSITLAHKDGTEVSIDVRVPNVPARTFVVRGFAPPQSE